MGVGWKQLGNQVTISTYREQAFIGAARRLWCKRRIFECAPLRFSVTASFDRKRGRETESNFIQFGSRFDTPIPARCSVPSHDVLLIYTTSAQARNSLLFKAQSGIGTLRSSDALLSILREEIGGSNEVLVRI